MVVIAIIGILASVVLASLNSSREKAKYATAQAQVGEIAKALEIHALDTNSYLGGSGHACANGNEAVITAAHTGGMMSSIPLDPWGRPYQWDGDYRCVDGAVGCPEGQTDAGAPRAVVFSCGPNKQCGYDNDNIVKIMCTR